MFLNYLKIASRNLFKNRLFSFINTLGLTIGMTSFLLIGLYIQYEFSYDRNHEKFDQIYRVSLIQTEDVFRGQDRFALTPAPLAPTLKSDYPEVEAATTICLNEVLFSKDSKYFYEEGLFADESVFDVFTFPVIEGVGAEALKEPDNILLTESLAKKYFGAESAIGKTITFQNERPLTIKGIIEDAPKNQHFTFDYITSLKNLPFYDEEKVWYSNTSWYSHNYYTYMVLGEGSNYKTFEEKLPALSRHYQNKYFLNGVPPVWFLQPLGNIHLRSQINSEIGVNNDIRYIYLFACIAFIILLLASINYMNLATAKSAGRAKEVGMRKVLGARRNQLVTQFLSESFLQSIICLAIAVALVNVLLPYLNQLLGQNIPFIIFSKSWLPLGALSIALIVGGLSGLYPAFFLTATMPIKALKGGILKDYKKGITFRNMMVVSQFVASIVLVVGSLVIFHQIKHIQNKRIGYNREQVLYVPYRKAKIYNKFANVRSKLLEVPGIEHVSLATYMPLNLNSQTTVEKWENNPNNSSIDIYRNYIDYEFLDLFEMELVAGRNFSPKFPTDTVSSYILNEAAVKALGWESAVGKQFHRGQVIGVVKDFHFQPFNLAIEPIFMGFSNSGSTRNGNIAIKFQTNDMEGMIDRVRSTLAEIIPEVPFDYRFMDESYNQLYKAELNIASSFNVFTALALFIACMGLFGLVAHQVLQRAKEIGIRKVLGATASNIVMLISGDFLKLVFIAMLIGFPIAWWGANKWLEGFAYHIEISWSVFVLSGLFALSIAFLTISIQSIKIALTNPIEVLRNE